MTESSPDRPGRYVLVVAGVFALALGARLVPLHWSPLPATLDGFRYAALARATIGAGVPWTAIDSDELVFTAGLAVTSAVTGTRPLALAQPFVSVVGAAVPLVGVAFAARLGREYGWPGRRVRLAAAVAGLGLAVEGLVVRRTGVPDEEAVGLLLVPLFALAAHRWLADGRPAWGGVTALFLLALPPLHNMSSLLGVLSVTALAVVHAVRATERAAWLRVFAVLAASWLAFFGYFELAARLGLRLTYSGLLRPYPGLFLAWVVALGVAIAWIQGASTRTVRLGVGVAVGGWLALAAGNAVRPLFPGTITTGPWFLVALAGLAVVVALALGAVSRIRAGTGLVVLATLAAPVMLVYYGLSAALTPEFFGAVQRIQSFAHVPVLALAAVGTVAVASRLGDRDAASRSAVRRGLAVGVVLLLALGVALTVPIGYLNLDTGTVPSTTRPAELSAAEFAAAYSTGPFATDHRLSRIVGHHTGTVGRATGTANATVGPVRSWLAAGPPPDCPVLAPQSWTTSGAHLYPQPAATIPSDRFERWSARRGVVYAATGPDPIRLVRPRNHSSTGC
jgi:hypothetical protein